MSVEDPYEKFDHPCKGTCSGWQQGFDKGVKAIDDKEVMSRFLHEKRMEAQEKQFKKEIEFLKSQYNYSFHEGLKLHGLTQNQILALKNFYEMQTGRRAEDIK